MSEWINLLLIWLTTSVGVPALFGYGLARFTEGKTVGLNVFYVASGWLTAMLVHWIRSRVLDWRLFVAGILFVLVETLVYSRFAKEEVEEVR